LNQLKVAGPAAHEPAFHPLYFAPDQSRLSEMIKREPFLIDSTLAQRDRIGPCRPYFTRPLYPEGVMFYSFNLISEFNSSIKFDN
jgi:hypothetical protein